MHNLIWPNPFINGTQLKSCFVTGHLREVGSVGEFRYLKQLLKPFYLFNLVAGLEMSHNFITCATNSILGSFPGLRMIYQDMDCELEGISFRKSLLAFWAEVSPRAFWNVEGSNVELGATNVLDFVPL